jgi:hypothetical protein
MPAPSLERLFYYEEAIEGAWNAILNVCGAQVAPMFSSADLESPRFETQLHSATPTGHEFIYKGARYWDAWTGQLLTRIVTSRGKSADFHPKMLGQARMLAMQWRTKFTFANLSWHSIAELKEGSLARYVDSDNDLDVSELTHAITFSIDTRAWPA